MNSKKRKDPDLPPIQATEAPALNLQALMGDFYAEADEHLQALKGMLIGIEESAKESKPISPKTLDDMFRHFHTLKGLCAMVGYREAEEASHFVESHLRAFRGKELLLMPKDLEAIRSFVSYIEQVIEAKRLNQEVPDIGLIKPSMEKLKGSEGSTGMTGEIPPKPFKAPEGTEDLRGKPSALPEEIEGQIREEALSGAKIFTITFTPSKEKAERGINVNSLRAVLQSKGKLLHAEPQVSKDGGISFRFIFSTKEGEGVLDELQGFEVTQEHLGLPHVPERPEGVAKEVSTPKTVGLGPLGVVRVDVSRIEALMGMVGDLVISRGRLEEFSRSLQREYGSKAARPLIEITQKMERQLKGLREAVMRLRMVPIADAFSRMQFVITDLIKDSGKEVNLHLKGKETEIDKFVVEKMVDPLLHLVRNSISHGIEGPEERRKAGKDPKGNVTLEASTSGDQVLISVSDDGRGLDRERIEKKAKEEGLLLPGEVMTEERIVEILCSQGFSTKEEADRASGRGVGMAVVKETISELGGELYVESEPNKGTKFTIALPLTLAITDAFIISAGNMTFAIPQGIVKEVIEIDPKQITESQGLELMLYRGKALYLKRLSRIFRLPEQENRKFFGLVIGTDRSLRCLLIDKVLGRREIVVRPITDPLLQVPGISGATELGDGKAVLILDSSLLSRMKTGIGHNPI